jgi:two-component system, cell cycle sensor histidine kinase and response regulator CckA
MPTPLKVLIVEDSRAGVTAILDELERGGYDTRHAQVETAEDMRTALDRYDWNVVLANYSMPRFSASEALKVLRASGRDLPFIIISDTPGEETAVAAIKAGAHDFLTKGRLDHLVPAIEREMAEAEARRDRERLESDLQQTRKMEALGRLAGGVAHDFNNLLTAIVGYGALLVDQVGRDTPAGRDVAQIIASAQKASSLSRQLLAFSHNQVFTSVPVNLNTVVYDIEPKLRALAGEGITVVVRLEPALHWVMADTAQLEQVLLNIAANARDAMPEGGVMTIETRNAANSDQLSLARAKMPASAYAVLSVQDTGVGMPPEIRARMFEPFFSTKEKGLGTGLGLAAVYGIARQLGGFIQVESEPGKGTRLEIYLPQTTRPSEAPTPKSVLPAVSSGMGTVLVVEDDDGVRALIRTMLERHAYRVLDAPSAEAAFTLMEMTPTPIDLLLSGVTLPGVQGPEFAATAVAARPAMKVLLISDDVDRPVAAANAFGGGWQLIAKPFSAPTLIGRIQQILGQQAV